MWWVYSHLTGSWNEQCLWFLSILTFCSWFLKSSLTCYCPTYTGDQRILLSTQEKANKQTKSSQYLLGFLPSLMPLQGYGLKQRHTQLNTGSYWSTCSFCLCISRLLYLLLLCQPHHFLSAWESDWSLTSHLLDTDNQGSHPNHISPVTSGVLSRVSGRCFWPWVLPMDFSHPVREGWVWATLLTTPLQA